MDHLVDRRESRSGRRLVQRSPEDRASRLPYPGGGHVLHTQCALDRVKRTLVGNPLRLPAKAGSARHSGDLDLIDVTSCDPDVWGRVLDLVDSPASDASVSPPGGFSTGGRIVMAWESRWSCTVWPNYIHLLAGTHKKQPAKKQKRFVSRQQTKKRDLNTSPHYSKTYSIGSKAQIYAPLIDYPPKTLVSLDYFLPSQG